MVNCRVLCGFVFFGSTCRVCFCLGMLVVGCFRLLVFFLGGIFLFFS